MGAYIQSAPWYWIMVWCPLTNVMVMSQEIRFPHGGEPDVRAYVDYLEIKYGYETLFGVAYRV